MSCREGGDWMCPACHHINFKKRESCQSCSCPRLASGAEVSSFAIRKTEEVVTLAGDWYCDCGAHNYASRATCYKCGASKDYCGYGAGNYGAAIPGWKTGDWICSRYSSTLSCTFYEPISIQLSLYRHQERPL